MGQSVSLACAQAEKARASREVISSEVCAPVTRKVLERHARVCNHRVNNAWFQTLNHTTHGTPPLQGRHIPHNWTADGWRSDDMKSVKIVLHLRKA
jgi:hypothetical protein